MKRLGIGILVLIGILGAAWVILPRLVSKEMLRNRLELALTERSGRAVEIGDVGFGLRPLPQIRATDLRIGRIGSSAPDQQIEVRSLDLALALRPLLRREVEIVRATIDGLAVDLFLPGDADGPDDETRSSSGDGSNEGRVGDPGQGLEGASGSAGAQDPSAGAGVPEAGDADRTGGKRSAVSVRIESLSFVDAVVRVHRGDTRILEMTGVREELQADVAIDGVVHYAGRTEVPEWKLTTPTGSFGHGLPIVLQKSLRFDPNEGTLRIESADLDLAGLPVTLTGRVSGLGEGGSGVPPDVILDLEFSGGPGRIENIVGMLPSAWVSRTGGLRSSGSVSVAGSVSGPVGPGAEPEFSLDVSLDDGRLEGGTLPAVIEALEATLRVSPTTVDVQRLTARAGTSRLSARGRVDEYQSLPRVDLAIDGNIDLALVTALQKSAPRAPGAGSAPTAKVPDLSGTAELKLVVRGSLPPKGDPARSLQPVGTIVLREVGVDGIETPIEALNGTAAVRGTELEANGIRFRMGESDVSVDGTVDDFWVLDPNGFGTPASTGSNLRIRSRFLDLDALAPVEAPRGSAAKGSSGSGKTSAGDGPTGGAASDRAQSGGAVGEGEPSGFELFAAFLSRLDGPVMLGIETARIRQIDWKGIEGRGSLRRGRIRIDTMNLGAFGGSLAATGDVDLTSPKNPRFDLDVKGTKLEAARFFTDNPGLSRLSGLGGFVRGVLDFTAEANGGLDEAFQLDLVSLTSLGNVQIAEGKITGHPIQTALATYLGQSDVRDLPIRDWLQPFRVRNGRVEFDQVLIKAGEFTLNGSGWTSIAGEVRLDADILVPAARTAALRAKLPAGVADVLFGSPGEPVLVPIKVTGPAAKPAVQLDDSRLTDRVRSRARQEMDAEKRKLEDKVRAEREALERQLAEEAKRKTRDVIGGLLPGRAPADSSRAASPDSAKGELEKEVKGLLKGLFGK